MEKNSIYNADCFEALSEFEDRSIDLIITDPPYGVLKDHKIETGIDVDKFMEMCYKKLKTHSFLIFFGMQPTFSKWIISAMENKFHYYKEIIWNKKQRSNPFGNLAKIHENIAVFRKGTATFRNVKVRYTDLKMSIADSTESRTILRILRSIENVLRTPERLKACLEYDINPKDFYEKGGDRITNDSYYDASLKPFHKYISDYKCMRYGNVIPSILAFSKHNMQKFYNDENNVKHPTVKPIKLMEVLIKLSVDKSALVVDPFLGSGTTALACLNTGNSFIGIEIDKDYCNMAKDRIEEHKKKPIQTELFELYDYDQ